MPSDKGILIAEGDSWFDLPEWANFKADNIVEGLKKHYQVISVAESGDTIEAMAFADEHHQALHKAMDNPDLKTKQPKAILISGGGNDLVDWLGALLYRRRDLRKKQSSLDQKMEDRFFDECLKPSYVHLIRVFRKACKARWPEEDIPVVVHGYGHPVPDGRSHRYFDIKFAGPWLRPVFERKGYKNTPGDLKIATIAMMQLIDRFNDVLRKLAKANEFKDYVCYIDVRDLLKNELLFTKSEHYKSYWDDELHPDERVFKKISNRFHLKIKSITSKPTPKSPGPLKQSVSS